ncbi:MAG: polysaccharide biosynthesis/export family protein [Candidatus Omnitrophota bacterium]
MATELLLKDETYKITSLARLGKIFGICCVLTAIVLSNSYAEDYLIGPDDVLGISVYREEELDRKVRVSSDGYFSFPLIGQVKADGMSVSVLKVAMEQMLKKYIKNPQVNIFIEEYSTITVTGQVKSPGAYPLKGELSVVEVIGMAGGFTKIAAQNNVKIMRIENNEKKTIRVKVADINKTGDKTKDVPLQRGDIIFVPESLF